MKRLADNLEVLSYSGVLLKDVRCSRFFNQLHYSHVKKKKKKKMRKVTRLLTVLLGMVSISPTLLCAVAEPREDRPHKIFPLRPPIFFFFFKYVK